MKASNMIDQCPIELRGIIPALNTPFDANDQVDLKAVRRLVDFYKRTGCVGILVPAVAAEAGSLTANERRAIVDTVLDAADENLKVIVGLSGLDSIERNRVIGDAVAQGAVGVLYNPAPEERGDALEKIVSEISNAGADFIMLQDLDWSGSGLDLDLIVKLFNKIPAFKALKIETVPAGPKYSRVLTATQGQMHVSGGWAAGQMIEALHHGVHAFVPCGMEVVYVTIFNRFQKGDVDGARVLFERLLPIIAFANQDLNVGIRFKKMLRVADGLFPTDHCRAPVPEFDPVQLSEARLMIKRAQALQKECGGL